MTYAYNWLSTEVPDLVGYNVSSHIICKANKSEKLQTFFPLPEKWNENMNDLQHRLLNMAEFSTWTAFKDTSVLLFTA